MDYGRFVVYILTNRRNGALYVGITRDIVRRLEEHRDGKVSGFACKHRLYQLVHAEFFMTAVEAIAREKQLKAWQRRWKVELIEAGNPYWRDLSRDR